jgi:hypothetical protein
VWRIDPLRRASRRVSQRTACTVKLPDLRAVVDARADVTDFDAAGVVPACLCGLIVEARARSEISVSGSGVSSRGSNGY